MQPASRVGGSGRQGGGWLLTAARGRRSGQLHVHVCITCPGQLHDSRSCCNLTSPVSTGLRQCRLAPPLEPAPPPLVHAGAVLADPMCGSGTLLIEAALMARRIAPGRFRWVCSFSDSADRGGAHGQVHCAGPLQVGEACQRISRHCMWARLLHFSPEVDHAPPPPPSPVPRPPSPPTLAACPALPCPALLQGVVALCHLARPQRIRLAGGPAGRGSRGAAVGGAAAGQ